MVSSLGTGAGYLSILVLALYIQDQHTAQLYHRPEFIWLACPLLWWWLSRAWPIAHRRDAGRSGAVRPPGPGQLDGGGGLPAGIWAGQGLDMSPATRISLLYGLFAGVSTLVNLTSQALVMALYQGPWNVEPRLGTAAGLPTKYLLDKRHIFRFSRTTWPMTASYSCCTPGPAWSPPPCSGHRIWVSSPVRGCRHALPGRRPGLVAGLSCPNIS